MLQPSQLEGVSVRYAAEIAEVRDFLAEAGLRVGTAECLGEVVVRLRNRAFHRDLSSHIWVVIDRWNGQISYSDLLGVLASAAAGTAFAAAAEEGDAHTLLRFLMEARRSFDAGWQEQEATRSYVAPPSTGALDSRREVFDRLEQPPRMESASAELPERTGGGRKRLAFAAAAACVLAALPAGLWLHYGTGLYRGTVEHTAPSASATVPSAPAGLATGRASSSVPRNGGAESTEGMPSPEAERRARVMPFSPVVRPSDSRSRALAAAPTPLEAATVPARGPLFKAALPAVSSAAAQLDNPASPASSLGIRPSPAQGAPASAVPASRLSQRLDSPTLPTYASAQDGELLPDGRRYPRLRRRQTARTSAAEHPDLLAALDPAGMPVVPVGVIHTDAGRAGTVRPTSVGIMAGNVLYSPSPAYPAAASAAHVQGEVKVQAEVDRQGNVAAARVVSGPPLLRDAALDAVQRWRYRPYLAAGKPIPMSAVAVVDFELP